MPKSKYPVTVSITCTKRELNRAIDEMSPVLHCQSWNGTQEIAARVVEAARVKLGLQKKPDLADIV